MKRLFFLLCLSVALNISAQEKHFFCYTTEEYKKEIESNPTYEKNKAELENYTHQFIENARIQRTGTRQIYIIPVVFHILHNFGPENISDAQVFDAVQVMTRDFRKRNADTIDIVSPFQSIAADCEIEFRLANIDPNGNCTNGIDRIVTNKTYQADNSSKLNPWPNDKYLNIWTANSLANAGAAAYAQYPGGANSTDGIMSLYDYVGSIGESDVFRSRTLTHETGHCLNLSHVWGNNNAPGVTCGDDFVPDTPISIGWSYCDLGGSTCNPPALENVQNYMEYSYCSNMFTLGQKARMQAALNSSLSGRNNLWTPANLIATGTDVSTATICAPIARFLIDATDICVGGVVQFTDNSTNAPVTGWSWSFPGGNPATSNSSNPSVTYNTGGLFDVILVATSAGGSDTITRVAAIHVTDTAMRTMPFAEDFETPASFPGIDGWIENPDNSVNGKWTWVSNANATTGGTHSLKINNFSNTSGEIDSWVTPSINFSNVYSPINLSFKVSNAQRSTASIDQLSLLYSLDCGQSWTQTSYNLSGSALATAGIVAFNYTPASASLWRQENVSINQVQNNPNVRFKFRNTSDRGNNTYIDDINITGTISGIDETDELQKGFSLYPNPSNGETTLNFGLRKSSRVIVSVTNILGQEITPSIDKTFDAGLHQHKLPVLDPGIYLVDLIVNNKHHIQKLVIS